MTKLTEEDIRGIIKCYLDGMNYTEIGKKYNVTRTTVTRKLKSSGAYDLDLSTKECEYCHTEFSPSKYGYDVQKYCSNTCRSRAYSGVSKEHLKLCSVCSKTFINERDTMFCSIECKKEYIGNELSKPLPISKNALRLSRARQNGQFDADIDIYKLIERDGEQCYLCGDVVLFNVHFNDPKYPTIEHVIPIAKGGTHSWDNVKVACRDCNTRKSTKNVELFTKEAEYGGTTKKDVG